MRDVLLKFIFDQSTSALGRFTRAWLAVLTVLCSGVGVLAYFVQIANGDSQNPFVIGIFFAVVSAFWLAVPVAIGLAIFFVAAKF